MEPTRNQNDGLGPTLAKRRSAETPERQCAVTRERCAPAMMVRFARAPDGTVTPDVSAKLPGRGVWVTATKPVLEKAIDTNVFAHGFKSQVMIPDDMVSMVENLLLQRCLGLLGMAKKGGAVILGFDQVRAELKSRPPGWLIEASDGSADGRGKVYSLAKALYETPRMASRLSSAELGMALGRERVIHGLISKGPFAKRWTVEYARLSGFRDPLEDDWFSSKDR